MATADEYAAWIVQNAHRKGSPEFDTVAQAYQLAKTEEAPTADQFRDKLAQETGPVESAVIGAGKTVDWIGRGVKQGVLGLASMKGDPTADAELARMKSADVADKKEYSRLEKAHPVATFVGETAPLVAALPVAGSMTGAAAVGAIPGLVGYGTPEERAMAGAGGAVGGAAGAGAGKLVSRALQPFRGTPTQSQQAAQQAAGRIGADLRASELNNSRPLRWFESSIADLPFAGGMAQKAEQARSAAINQAANRSMGQAGSEVTEQTFAAARQTIGGEFQRILNPLDVTLDKPFQNEVRTITGSKVLKELRDDSVEALLAPFRNLPQGTIKVKGDWFQQNKTALDDAIRGAYTAGQNGKAKALEGFEEALDKAATRSMSAADRAAYDTARKQWASLRMLETGKVVEGGNVMPGRLDSALTTRYKQAYKEGKITGELADIGKMSQAYKPLPQSGTTPRAFYSGAAGALSLANPVGGAAMLAAPALAQKFLQSAAGKKYLTQGLLSVSPDLERALMMGGAGLFGLPLATATH